MKIVSACLAGIPCRYDGRSKPCQKIVDLVRDGQAIAVCPEQLGGLTTPRDPAEQKGATVLTKTGEDVTAQFEKGAEEALHIARRFHCKEAILKSKSPSCGSGTVYDGTFSGQLINGDGVFTKKLKKNCITVYSENDIQ